MPAYVFPGQGAQFEGMGKNLFDESDLAKTLFQQANDILGFDLMKVKFEGTAEELKQTRVTQPAIFLHSVISSRLAGDNFQATAVAGHSLGEFSALVAAGSLDFESGLKLVSKRALAMQHACELTYGTMAAILGLEDQVVEEICKNVNGVVVAANYNCPGQLVISGEVEAIEWAIQNLLEAGAKRAIALDVGGAFHSPLMEHARDELREAIEETVFKVPVCPVYQNVDGKKHLNPEKIKINLIEQLTRPVRWTQTIQEMIKDGHQKFVEVGGKGRVLGGLIRKIDKSLEIEML